MEGRFSDADWRGGQGERERENEEQECECTDLFYDAVLSGPRKLPNQISVTTGYLWISEELFLQGSSTAENFYGSFV